MTEITIREARVHYIEGERFDRSRPTLLFVHGAGQSVATWKFQFGLFKNHPHFNFIALDLPGHGGSEGEGLRSVAEYKDFLLKFIDTLKLQNIILIGHSMGGGIAMLLAIERPEILKACVLAATGAKLSVAQQTLDTVKNNYEAFCEIAPQRMFAEDSPQELKQEFKQGLIDIGQEVCYWDLVTCNEFDILDDVHKITLPTLIVSADKDMLTPVKYGEYLHQKIYGSEFYEIKGSGHFIMQEKSQEFNIILENFLNNFIE
ncbi:MAG: alpha/beta hydrolase [Thermodesulfobacteriales bacterium]|jgi:pimeloyl-ACP methyl ester carboxylesterase|nr:MAG: alpha/beta hydrolase [Thermodesulfobacteriales bacterium]